MLESAPHNVLETIPPRNQATVDPHLCYEIKSALALTNVNIMCTSCGGSYKVDSMAQEVVLGTHEQRTFKTGHESENWSSSVQSFSQGKMVP